MADKVARARFGAEVRRRRESIQMTLEVLAARSGLTPNYIGTGEAGRRDPSLSTILGLARGLGISPAELFSSRAGLSPAAGEAGRLFDLVDPSGQEPIMMLLRSFAKPRPRKPRPEPRPEPRKPRKPQGP